MRSSAWIALGVSGLLVCAVTPSALPAKGETSSRVNSADPESYTSVIPASIRQLDQQVQSGRMTLDESAREKIYFLFDRGKMQPANNLDGDAPARCGTWILEEIRRDLSLLTPETRELFDLYTGSRSDGTFDTQMTLVHETAHFYIEYVTMGAAAVPSEDVDPANGVPDFVERVAESCEFSWTESITNLTYAPPPATSTSQYNGKYLIQFQSQGSYGYTTVTSGSRTKIVLHPNYIGFPPNDDPDGDILGAMRVTVAHELKHAIQRVYTFWSEGGWVELDATWMEDIVYDGINDYYNYLSGSGSPFTNPELSLDNDGSSTTGSYEDCNWQLYQTEKHGNAHMKNFWSRRFSFPSEPVLTTYQENFINSGTTFSTAWGEYAAWNAVTGSRAGNAYGYGEAPEYPTSSTTSVTATLPIPTSGGSVNHLASNFHVIANEAGTIGGTPEFSFDGDVSADWQVSVVLTHFDGTITRQEMTLVFGSAVLELSGLEWADYTSAVLVIGNASTSGTTKSYTYSVRSINAVQIVHQNLWNTIDTSNPYSISALVTSGSESLDASSITLYYSVDGGGEQSLIMTATGNPDEFSANIPAENVGASIDYRIEAQSLSATTVVSPARAGTEFGFDIVTVFDPLESPGSWTVGDAGDAASTGVWEHVIPISTGAAPGADFTLAPGESCFVTENGVEGGDLGAADVDGGKTTLKSPIYDLGSGAPYESVTLRYRRWYSNGLGATVDDTWLVEISNNGGSDWVTLETTTSGSEEWVQVSTDLMALLTAPDQVQVRFIAEDAPEGSIVEAAVDDFEIIAIQTSTVAVGETAVVSGLRLSAGVPNPLAGSRVSFSLQLPRAGVVQANIMDIRGRIVRELIPSGTRMAAGQNQIVWDGRSGTGAQLASGVYYLRVTSEQGAAARKITLLR